MANAWFRLYSEFATDPKVQMLSESYQRRLIMVFCMRCNGDVTLHDEEVAFQLRISNEEWAETKAVFVAKGFTNEANEVLNWDKRQFVTGDANLDAVSKSSNYVYFVADTSQSVVNNDFYVVKVGVSKNPWARLKDLQTANSNKLEIVAKFRADVVSESQVHELLRAYRINGEWFKVPSLLASDVIRHSNEKGSNYESLCNLVVAVLRSKATVATNTTTDTEQIQNRTDTEKTNTSCDHPADGSPESVANQRKKTGIPYQSIVDLYHQALPMCPSVMQITTKRKGQIAARWNSGALPDLETWKAYFEHCAQSKFLTGSVDPPSGRKRFIADIEWLTNETNFTKVWEGKYHG